MPLTAIGVKSDNVNLPVTGRLCNDVSRYNNQSNQLKATIPDSSHLHSNTYAKPLESCYRKKLPTDNKNGMISLRILMSRKSFNWNQYLR